MRWPQTNREMWSVSPPQPRIRRTALFSLAIWCPFVVITRKSGATLFLRSSHTYQPAEAGRALSQRQKCLSFATPLSACFPRLPCVCVLLCPVCGCRYSILQHTMEEDAAAAALRATLVDDGAADELPALPGRSRGGSRRYEGRTPPVSLGQFWCRDTATPDQTQPACTSSVARIV